MFEWINRLDRYFPIRYGAWALCIVGFIASDFATRSISCFSVVVREPPRL